MIWRIIFFILISRLKVTVCTHFENVENVPRTTKVQIVQRKRAQKKF